MHVHVLLFVHSVLLCEIYKIVITTEKPCLRSCVNSDYNFSVRFGIWILLSLSRLLGF
jgi:hypothetical protein